MKKKTINVHFMGIGGSGLAGVAILAQKAGFKVSGCDLSKESYYTQSLLKHGIKPLVGHHASHLSNVNILAVSPAVFDVSSDHPEFLEAKKRGILMTWQEFMGEYLQKGKFVIAISGTHGKSTTTALVGLVLEKGGLDPIVEVGAVTPKWKGTVRIGSSKYFVCEADEFNYNFLNYSPSLIVINNIEMDHPEFFKNFKQFQEAFEKFIRKLKGPKILIVNEENQGVRGVLTKMKPWFKKEKVRVIGYFLTNKFDFPFAAEYQGKIKRISPRFTYFEVLNGLDSQEFKLKLPGVHNVANALGVVAAATELRVAPRAIKEVFESFRGVRRRLEKVGEEKKIKVFDDYGHHPTAIAATLEAVKARYPKAKVWAVIEPHQISRLRLFMEEFATALRKAEGVVVSKIFLGREKNVEPIDPLLLVQKIGLDKASYIERFEEVAKAIASKTKAGDIVVVFGAGKSYQLSRLIIKELKEK